MLLVVDVGNTQTVIGLIDGGASSPTGASPPCGTARATRWPACCRASSRCSASACRDVVDEVAVASVVPRLTAQWVVMSEKHLGSRRSCSARRAHRHAHPAQNPAEVGADRIANAVAATSVRRAGDRGRLRHLDQLRRRHGQRRLRGRLDRARRRRSRWRRSRACGQAVNVDVSEPGRAIGRDRPRPAVGAVYGFAGQVDGIVGAIRGELGKAAPVVATAAWPR